MIIPISFEPKETLEGKEDILLFDIESGARIKAIQKQERAPTLTELLYHQSEDEMMTIYEFLDNE
jgi:hypothetical protein